MRKTKIRFYFNLRSSYIKRDYIPACYFLSNNEMQSGCGRLVGLGEKVHEMCEYRGIGDTLIFR